jgi:hypothetical protein
MVYGLELRVDEHRAWPTNRGGRVRRSKTVKKE